MSPARKRKLFMILFFMTILALAAGLVLYALRQNISLFYTPTQIAAGQAPLAHPIRIGGMVEKNSIVRAKEGLEVQFKITDFDKTIIVTYTGILPDLFREGQGIVAEGEATDTQNFRATQVLAKHDANYMPPEVKAALSKKVAS
jgi:cytochrome c-type biogenesis protein CcmE